MNYGIIAGINSETVIISPLLLTLVATKLIIPNIIFIYFLMQNPTVLLSLDSHFEAHSLPSTSPLCLVEPTPLYFHYGPRGPGSLPVTPPRLAFLLLRVVQLPPSAASPSFSLCVRVHEAL